VKVNTPRTSATPTRASEAHTSTGTLPAAIPWSMMMRSTCGAARFAAVTSTRLRKAPLVIAQ